MLWLFTAIKQVLQFLFYPLRMKHEPFIEELSKIQGIKKVGPGHWVAPRKKRKRIIRLK